MIDARSCDAKFQYLRFCTVGYDVLACDVVLECMEIASEKAVSDYARFVVDCDKDSLNVYRVQKDLLVQQLMMRGLRSMQQNNEITEWSKTT